MEYNLVIQNEQLSGYVKSSNSITYPDRLPKN